MADEPSGGIESRKTKKEGNESLWKRARRTLGSSANQLDFMQTQSRPRQGLAAEGEPGLGSHERRRDQVRHAQRTHRQRTQNYIKTLEQEVIRVRNSETSLMQERDKLRAQIDVLKNAIYTSNIPLPSGLTDVSNPQDKLWGPTSDQPVTVSYAMDDFNHPRLHIESPLRGGQGRAPQRQSIQTQVSQLSVGELSSDESADPEFQSTGRLAPGRGGSNSRRPSQENFGMPGLRLQSLSTQDPAQATKDLSQKTQFLNQQQVPSLRTTAPSLHQNQNPASTFQQPQTPTADLNTYEVAIDFILALEYPCMPHVPHPSSPQTANPSGHLALASTSLVNQAPSPPQPNTRWTVPQANIQTLLDLSSSLSLEGEITPVEAWNQLSHHPNFGRCTRQTIEVLKGNLSAAVRCEGFGAVMDEHVFWATMNSVLGP